MPKLDSNIYGSDDQGFASGISSDALGPPSSKSPIDQSAFSKGNGNDDAGDVKIVSNKGGKSETKGNH